MEIPHYHNSTTQDWLDYAKHLCETSRDQKILAYACVITAEIRFYESKTKDNAKILDAILTLAETFSGFGPGFYAIDFNGSDFWADSEELEKYL